MHRFLTKRNGMIAGAAVIIIAAAVILSTTFSQALTLDEAKEIASKYVPSTAKFVTSEEEENKYEVMFRDDDAGEGFEVEVHKDTKMVKKVETQMDNDMGSETVKLAEDDVKEIIKKRFEGVTSVSVTLKKDNGRYVYDADFKSNAFYGDAEVHPETGVILESTVKYGTAVTIPTENQDNGMSEEGGAFISYEEAERLVIEKAGGGFVKDIDLENERGKYVYEIELIKDYIEYDYIVDAETGEVTLENEHESYFDYDSDDAYDYVNPGTTEENSENKGQISFEKAKSIVDAKIPGATITELKLEKDDGRFIWEGEAVSGDYEYEFEIDANSGVIIDWEKDLVDEWDD